MTKEMVWRRKIGILGCAIPTLALAPFDDAEWTLWAHGQLQDDLKRWDAWCETHDIEKLPPPFQQHVNNLQAADYPIFGLRPSEYLPDLQLIPRDKIIAEYGKEFLTSTCAWMMAYITLELDPVPEEVGLWGVEMSSEGEYFFQRAGCKFFQRELEKKGVKVTIPPQSDLAREREVYPEAEESRFAMWLRQREGIVQSTRNQLEEQKKILQSSIDHHEGGLEIFKHIRLQQGY